MHSCNSYIQSFKYALETIHIMNFNVSADDRPVAENAGLYNTPFCNEVVVLLHKQERDKRDIDLTDHVKGL